MATANQIRINTGIDTSAISKGIAKVRQELDDLKSKAEDYDKITQSIEKDERNLAMLRAKKANNQGDKYTDEAIASFEKAIARQKAQLQELNAEEERKTQFLQDQLAELEYQKQVLSAIQAERTSDELSGRSRTKEELETNIRLLENAVNVSKMLYGEDSEIVKALEKELALQKKINNSSEETVENVKKEKTNREFFTKSIKTQSDGMSKVLGTTKNLTLSLLGASTVYGVIRKIIGQAVADNQQLANTISGFFTSLATIVQPIISMVISGLATVMNYILSIFSYLTGINLLAKANAKLAKKSGGGGKKNKVNKLASFDTSEEIKKDTETDGFGGIGDSLLKQIKLNEKLLEILDKVKKYFAEIGQIIKDWWANVNFQPLIDSLGRLWEAFSRLVALLGEGFKWILENILLPFASWTIEEGLPALIDALASAFQLLATALEIASPYLEQIWNDYFKPLAEWLGQGIVDVLTWIREKFDELNAKMQENPEEAGKIVAGLILIIGAIGLAVPVIKWLIDKFTQVKEPVEQAGISFQKFIENIGKAVLSIAILGGLSLALSSLSKVIDSLNGLLTTMHEKGISIWELMGTMLAILVPLGGALALLVAFATPLSVALAEIGLALAPLALTLPPILDAISNFVTSNAEAVVSMFQTVDQTALSFLANAPLMLKQMLKLGEGVKTLGATLQEELDKYKAIFESIPEWLDTNVWERVTTSFKEQLNIMLGYMQKFTDAVATAMDAVASSINALSIDIPSWVPNYGGMSWHPSMRGGTRVNVPLLAKGAVLPPNKPFMAMLGDQRNGTNLEAPEDLIRQIVREESGAQEINIVADGSLSQFIKLIRFELQKEDKRVGNSLVMGG